MTKMGGRAFAGPPSDRMVRREPAVRVCPRCGKKLESNAAIAAHVRATGHQVHPLTTAEVRGDG